MKPVAIFFIFSALLLASLQARPPKIPEAVAPGEVKPGKISLLTSPKGARYFLRVPRKYDDEKGARLIVFLHGSNMNGLQYLQTFESERWCRDDIIVCPNGEQGDDPFGANNFNFGSADLVAEVTKQVKSAYKTTKVYLGGHSQGGFLTYSAIMLHPELFDGAFPMAGDCWSQNEPNLWETKPEILAKQKEIAIAVIHGQADPIVKFSQGEHAHGVFLAMGYPKLRLFAPEKLGHQFGLSPVPEALDWLDAMTGLNPEEGMKLSRTWFREKEWGWVHQAALAVLAHEDTSSSDKSAAQRAIEAVEKEATTATATMKKAMENKDAQEWIPEWYQFQQHFGAAEAASALIEAYNESRSKERSTGRKLFQSTIAKGRNKDSKGREEALQTLLKDAPHSFHAYYAWKWLGNSS